MKGPFRFKKRLEEKMGGVYVILSSPHAGLYNYAYVDESDDMRKDFSSIFLRRTWKKECKDGVMYFAYLCTDDETCEMDDTEAKIYRTRIMESLRTKYESERNQSKETIAGPIEAEPISG